MNISESANKIEIQADRFEAIKLWLKRERKKKNGKCLMVNWI